MQKPLAKPIRDRVEREVSYKKSQVEVAKWVPQIKQNREAECIDYTQEVPLENNLPSMAAARPGAQTKLQSEITTALRKQGIETETQIRVRPDANNTWRRRTRRS